MSALDVSERRRRVVTRLEKPIDDDRMVYPWASMVVGGEGFFVPKEKRLIQPVAYSYGCRNLKKFKGRSVPGGCVFWRVK
jgi:hypothetical protein